jgi:hypothetical protein
VDLCVLTGLDGALPALEGRSFAPRIGQPWGDHHCRLPPAIASGPEDQVRELMEYMGHSSLQATERYVKLLPPLDETDPAERLNAYLSSAVK